MMKTVSDAKSEVFAHLDELADLPPRWDGYHAPRIDPKIIAQARQLIHAMPANFLQGLHCVPVSSGGLQFEWHQGPRTLELEWESPQTIHYLKWHPEAGVEEEDLISATAISNVKELFDWFSQGEANA